MRAVCHRCGGIKAGPFLPCPDCLHTPRAEDRALAWLFSAAHLSTEELELAARRIQTGEQPEPSRQLLAHATANMSSSRGSGGPPLSRHQLVGIGLGSIALTPLMGLSIWWGYRTSRPLAAKQALRVTVPVSVVIGVFWFGVIALRLLA